MNDQSAERVSGYEDSFDIAIVGMAGRFPSAPTVEDFWQNLCAGRSSVTFFSEQELIARGVRPEVLRDPQYVRAGNLLADVDLFDAEFFGFSPRDAELMDPQQRILLECAWEALEDAGHDPGRYDGPIGVYTGQGSPTYLMVNLARNSGVLGSVSGGQLMMGSAPDFLSTRICYKLGLTGPGITVQSACSTSLVSVVLACQGLLAYHCDMALAGGVSIDVLKGNGYRYEEGGLFSPDGYCRTFDARAQGTIGGNGVGLVVLKRLHDAIVDGDQVHAVIKGSAVNNDGSRRAGFSAPSAESQALTITTALANAVVEPNTIGFVEAHGTATALGDPIEVSALHAAFATGEGEPGRCALGAVKTNIGHLDSAAGIAGLIKAVLAVRHGQIPPTLHFEHPNPRIDLDSGPFFVNTELAPWPVTTGPRRAGVSSFGMGGTNAHIVLEQAPPRSHPVAGQGPRLLTVSARDPIALEAATDRLADFLRVHPDVALADVAYTLAAGRMAFSHRRILVCDTVEQAARALDARADTNLLTGESGVEGRRPVAFTFPGFGDQYPGMAGRLYRAEPVFRQAVDDCAGLLTGQFDVDLRTLLFEESVQQETAAATADLRSIVLGTQRENHPLDRPVYGHCAVFAVEYALVRLWESWGVRPDAMIGHSLGEFVAACVAGVFSLPDVLSLIVARAELIERQRGGAMLAVPLTERELDGYLGDEVAIGSVNAPSTCVLSGTRTAIEVVAERLLADGVVSRRLPTEYAVHSPMMEPVVRPYLELLSELTLSTPKIRFVSNVTGDWITDQQATDPEYWARHVCSPVRFADGLATLWAVRDVILVEVGPGQSLTAAALQHPASRQVRDRLALATMPDSYTPHADHTTALRALGRLWLAGVLVDRTAPHAGQERRRLSLPTYPFQRRRYWVEPDTENTVARVGATSRRADLSAWFHVPSWQRLADRPTELGVDPGTQRWLVFVDERGIGRELVARLEKTGARVAVAIVGKRWSQRGDLEFVLDPASAADYQSLAEQLRGNRMRPDRVVHCWSVDGSVRDDADAMLDRGFHSLVRWARAAEADMATTAVRWDVVTAGAYGVTGDEQLCPAKAAVQGVCKVAPQEYPFLSCAQIDLRQEVGVDQVEPLLAELTSVPPDGILALRGDRRWGQTFVPMPAGESTHTPLRPNGVYLITGGLGRIGLVLARSLARAVRARLVLVGRTALPSEEDWDDPALPAATRAAIEAVRELASMGAEVMVRSADVSDRQRLADVLAEATERFGPVNGVIHAAGLTGPSAHHVLSELDTELSDQHFRPKLHGTVALDEVLAGTDLDFAILCSSLSPLLGGLGLAAYAAANAFQDAFAQAASALGGTRWTSVNWEGWRFPDDEVGGRVVGVTLRDLVIDPDEGRLAFERLLSLPPQRQIVLSTTDVGLRARMWANPGRQAVDVEVRRHARPNLSVAFVAPSTESEQAVAGIWQDLLGVEQVGVDDNFFDLGGSSLLGVQVIHQLRTTLGVAVPLTIVYQGPTVRTLAELISGME